jgi:magnesium chelatase subunit D
MTPSFPFPAIVGQETLKRALLLAVIQPSLGGVLIRGTKGVAKSTAVRALANLLPPIETVAGCPFQRAPDETWLDWPLPPDAPRITRLVPLIELPLGATEDRVLGSLHLEKALRGERSLEPGLLAAANRGILYVDEVNLLPDHLVDILLDAAASGIHQMEREGLSIRHPARFVLIGTMNPEEGELRPQLLDRFGLVADVADLADPQDRAEAVHRRLAYEADPAGFAEQWEPTEREETTRIVRAQHLLPSLRLSSDLLTSISERCLQAGVDGLRADLTIARAATAWAAYQGRTNVEEQDLEVVAELALAHRRHRSPEPPPNRGPKLDDRKSRIEDGKAPTPVPSVSMPVSNAGQTSVFDPQSSVVDSSTTTLRSAGVFLPRIHAEKKMLGQSTWPGRWRNGQAQGRTAGRLRVFQPDSVISWAATLRAAALHQTDRRFGEEGSSISLRVEDLRGWQRRGPTGCLLFFVVDASGSMAAWQRMRQTKSAVLSLLRQAYQRRDQIALLAFRASSTELVLSPTRALKAALHAIEQLPVGGTTPLALALVEAERFVRRHRRRQPHQPIWLILLTDGRANVALRSGDPWQDALSAGRNLRNDGLHCLVIDTETGWPRFGRAADLAPAMNARCLPLKDVLGRPIQERWPLAV